MDNFDWLMLGLVAFTLLIVFSTPFGIWFKASQEAKSYNKFCDTPVTTWDALWLDLRIDECN